MSDYNKTLSKPRAVALAHFGRSHIMKRAWAIAKSFSFKGSLSDALRAAWAECASMVIRWAKSEKRGAEQHAFNASREQQRSILSARGRDSYRYGMACAGR